MTEKMISQQQENSGRNHQNHIFCDQHPDYHPNPYEKQHKAIIDRFGRYPHRNAILARSSTAEELEFLTQPNSRF